MKQKEWKQKEKHRILGTSFLLLAAIVWGVAFVAQSEGMRYMGPFYFNGIRFALGGIVLLPVIWLMDGMEQRKDHKKIKGKKTTPCVVGRWFDLWFYSFYRQYISANGYYALHCGESWIYYHVIYYFSSPA